MAYKDLDKRRLVRRAYMRRFRASHKAALVAWRKSTYPARRLRVQNRLQLRRALLDWLKTGLGCADCGYATRAIALDFDHVRGKKTKGISYLYHCNMNRLQAELGKCEVVCANCHRIRTQDRQQYRKANG